MAQGEPLADVPLQGGAEPPAGLAWVERGTGSGEAKAGTQHSGGGCQKKRKQA